MHIIDSAIELHLEIFKYNPKTTQNKLMKCCICLKQDIINLNLLKNCKLHFIIFLEIYFNNPQYSNSLTFADSTSGSFDYSLIKKCGILFAKNEPSYLQILFYIIHICIFQIYIFFTILTLFYQFYDLRDYTRLRDCTRDLCTVQCITVCFKLRQLKPLC